MSAGLWCNLALLLQLGGARSSQPLDKPERPDHEKREKEHSSTRKERRCKICCHVILQGVLIACSLDSSLAQRWCPAVTMSRAIRSFEAGRLLRPSSNGPADQATTTGLFAFRNWRRPSRKTPASANVDSGSGGTYQITVGIERAQKTRLIGAGIWLNSPQCVFVYEK